METTGDNKMQVVAVNISEKKGVRKTPVEYIDLVENFGIKGDAHGGDWHRQVSLLGHESMVKQDIEGLSPGDFAENILTSGIVLYELPIGTRIRLGEAVLEVTQIGKECHHGCEIRQLTGDCVMPREGIFAKVIKEGRVRPQDPIELVED